LAFGPARAPWRPMILSIAPGGRRDATATTSRSAPLPLMPLRSPSATCGHLERRQRMG
jgi:hypothetical protein